MSDTMTDQLGANGDYFYTTLMEAHEGLSEADSHALNARLVLMMANEIADISKLEMLLKNARRYSDEK